MLWTKIAKSRSLDFFGELANSGKSIDISSSVKPHTIALHQQGITLKCYIDSMSGGSGSGIPQDHASLADPIIYNFAGTDIGNLGMDSFA